VSHSRVMVIGHYKTHSFDRCLLCNREKLVKTQIGYSNIDSLKGDYADTKMRVLLFSYFYPPLGGPGIQRPCKMVYYFRQGGWDVDVISVKDIVFHSYDEDMQDECKENFLYRVKSWDLMSLLHQVKGSKKTSSDKKLYFQTPEKFKRIVREIFPIDEKSDGFLLPTKWEFTFVHKNSMMQLLQQLDLLRPL